MYRVIKTQILNGEDRWIVVDNINLKNAIGDLKFESRDIASQISASMNFAFDFGGRKREGEIKENLEELLFAEKQGW